MLKRKLLPAILALSTMGSIAAGSAAVVMTSTAPAVVAASHEMKPDFIYHA